MVVMLVMKGIMMHVREVKESLTHGQMGTEVKKYHPIRVAKLSVNLGFYTFQDDGCK